MYNENSSATTNGEKASLFNTYFKSVFTKSNFVLPSSSDIVTPDPIISDITISEEAVYKALASLNPTKAMGIDNIGPKVLKICAASLTIPLHHLFLMCLSQCKIPSEWKIHKITPVFKSGDRTLIKNYRPISLLSSISKVFERLIYNEISDFVTSAISPSQFGFLPNQAPVCNNYYYLQSQYLIPMKARIKGMWSIWTLGKHLIASHTRSYY